MATLAARHAMPTIYALREFAEAGGLRRMMGRREGGQGQFFYVFDLDKVVPPLVRQIEGVLDLSWVHRE